ncbi:MAG: dTMP kinase [Pseudomonadota bacterium]
MTNSEASGDRLRPPGAFIVFEGGEGSGKSTQSKRLAARLSGLGEDTLLTREPGGTDGAEAIRTLLVTGKVERWDAMTELLLINAARRDHVERVIRPALNRGTHVICDRFLASTIAYQGIAKGLGEALIRKMHQLAIGDLLPDLTVLMDIAPEIGLARAKNRFNHDDEAVQADRFEHHHLAFHRALRESFLDLATRDQHNHLVVDANVSMDDIAERIDAQISQLLAARSQFAEAQEQ